MIDRTSPAQRPDGPNAGTQQWRSLLFCHWELDVGELRQHVPAELEIDTFEGRGFVGVVPFRMCNIRPRWVPQRFALNFLETNVRTYVVYNGRPGVYFFSLDASSWLAVGAARVGWSLPYHHARMSATESGERGHYQSHRTDGSAEHRVSFRRGRPLGRSRLGTLEHFLLERYLLFTPLRGQIAAGQVHHAPYHAHQAEVDQIHDGLVSAAGLPAVTRPPDFAHFSPGVDVEVFGLKKAS